MNPARILVADDESNIRDVVQYALERDGYRVETAADGQSALARIEAGGIDLVILDVLMPELDGLNLCRKLRERGDVPIIFLSSRSEEADRILGLELGGDDYVTKPFSPRELATRVKAVLRRVAARRGADDAPPALVYERLTLDPAAHELRVDDDKIALTVTEFRVLHAILERPGRVLTRSQLIDRAYEDGLHVSERTIDTHIRRIRAKLRPYGIEAIETVHGLGYKTP
ncbi:response regulator transcription factor [Haliangium ochraceum]|uniref:Two component transcriptional regulator, winged helix family n=1 Tax=Haliangium ochraceum (strain DSM 14365 / JCM 11303 / SMP-2) TaxID=502025 RepID=D0LHP7_HALO1|nr:response regulator transcription factor [Haliangium ochraceum]ACY12909.1 two component transcriptional regulator, winged helix family [Haliangium ochraceum DSM 14365]